MSALLLAGIVAAQIAPDEFAFDLHEQIRPPIRKDQLPQTPLFVDFTRAELHARLGVAEYSEDYVADPAPAGAFMIRAPMPWLSPESDAKGDFFGIFMEATFATIDRDITPALAKPSGTVMLFSLGVDYTFVRNDRWLLRAFAGGQWGAYGGVTDLDDGLAGLVGGVAGFRLSYKFWLTYSPELVIANAGDWIGFNLVGVMIEF